MMDFDKEVNSLLTRLRSTRSAILTQETAWERVVESLPKNVMRYVYDMLCYLDETEPDQNVKPRCPRSYKKITELLLKHRKELLRKQLDIVDDLERQYKEHQT